ncbi:calcium-binding protein, partial [Ruegeria aquimaris]
MVDPSLFTTVSDNTLLPFGGTLIAQGDDNEEGPFDITAIFETGFSFGSQTFTEMFIGTNGGVTFNIENPQVFFGNTLNAIDFSIAPFNDDMDTRTLPPGPNPGVYFDTNTDRDSVVVTWNTIGRFSNNVTTPNTFQLEIMDLGDGDAELIFRFFDMQGSNGQFHMGARTDDGLPVYLSGGAATDQLGEAANLETLVGNTGVAGVWQMRVIDGQLQPTDFGGEVQTGNAANNTLNGSPLNDVLSGGAGNDTIFGFDGIDTLNGNEDNDSILGGDDADLIHGDDGNDTLRGEEGNDSIFGDTGDDSLFGGSGTNELEGGAGADALDGSGGTSIAAYTTSATGLRVDLSNTSSNTGDAVGDTYTNLFDLRGSAFGDELVGDNNSNDLFGGAGNDSLTGNDGNDLLEGQEDDDLLNGGAGNDTLDGGLGADNLIGGTGNDFASYRNATSGVVADLFDRTLNTGEAAGDTYSEILGLTGSKFADTLGGNTGNNDLRGDDGDDLLIGREGNDTLLGEDHDDVLVGGLGSDQLNGGSGLDTASYADAATGVLADLASSGSNTGEAAGDTYNSIENLIGSTFADTLRGDNGDNLLSGGAANDSLVGSGGDDTLRGGTGEDTLVGGSGSDTADYSEAAAGLNADLSNSAGNTGEARGDVYSSIENLMGSGFGDTLTGNNGNNTLSGMAGDDLLHGNGGTDGFDGGEGSDTVTYSGGNFVVVDLEDNSANAGEAAGDTFTGVEHLIGSDNSDDLLGDDENNNFFGGGNVDILNGRGGDDTLRGGAGNDTLTGGTGADHFMVETGMGSDVVTDFTLGEDSIDFSLLSSAERDAVTFSTNGSGDRVVNLGDGSTMTLTGVPGNSAPTGSVTISGTARQGETLTANTDGVSDPDGIDT